MNRALCRPAPLRALGFLVTCGDMQVAPGVPVPLFRGANNEVGPQRVPCQLPNADPAVQFQVVPIRRHRRCLNQWAWSDANVASPLNAPFDSTSGALSLCSGGGQSPSQRTEGKFGGAYPTLRLA